MLGLFADDFVVRASPVAPWGGRYHGAEALIGMSTDLATHLDVSQMQLLNIVAEADTVVVLFLAPYRRTPETETALVQVTEWYTFENGAVVDLSVFYWDRPPVG